jgi:two-component system sensor histidine kinase BaeS
MGGPSLTSARPSATVDALQADTALAGGDADAAGIHVRAVGPYQLTNAERSELWKQAQSQRNCAVEKGFSPATIVERPNGRPVLQVDGSGNLAAVGCASPLGNPTDSEIRALEQLAALSRSCLGLGPSERLSLSLTFRVYSIPRDEQDRARQDGCVQAGRRTQLKPYVAPPALLFVTDPDTGTAQPTINLSRENVLRIAGGTGLVLLLAVTVTVIVGTRLVRPLRRLIHATGQPAGHGPPVPVTTRDEIGVLATALNEQSARREQLEIQRSNLEQQRKAMVSDVAHELRTPLTNIRSWLEAAQDGIKPADLDLVDLLLEEALLLQHIIDDLRDLAAADAGNLQIHPERVYVNDLITQVIDAHREAAERGGVRLGLDPHTDPELDVDPVRLRQLVGNLVSNGVRHTPSGGSVTVHTSVTGHHVVIEVVDTGIGITPEHLPKVFDRFWRADSSRNRATGGSGLGLAIVRKITEAHHGSVDVTSELGTGTTFTIRLPA